MIPQDFSWLNVALVMLGLALLTWDLPIRKRVPALIKFPWFLRALGNAESIVADVAVESEGFVWKRGFYSEDNERWGLFPHCSEHGTRLLYREDTTQGMEYDPIWNIKELEDNQHRSFKEWRGPPWNGGDLFCPSGHGAGWFSDSDTVKAARLRADMLRNQAIEMSRQSLRAN